MGWNQTRKKERGRDGEGSERKKERKKEREKPLQNIKCVNIGKNKKLVNVVKRI